MPSELPSAERVRDVLASYVERRAAGEAVSVEALCRAHPSLAGELLDLVPVAEAMLERLSSSLAGSLHQRLSDLFGSDVDPQVTLEGEGRGSPQLSSEVLSRLAGRGPATSRYRIHGEVAHGGMGAVLRVWDEDLRRHLAMKVLLASGVERGDTCRAEPRLLSRFIEEAQITGQLDHPGIVPVHELGLDSEGRVFFTMKLVQGKTLGEVFAELSRGEGGWTQTRALGLIQKVCEAMSYAHAKGVIHRDLKPANVMVGHFGEVFAMDWGLAKILDREDAKDIRIREVADPAAGHVRSDRRHGSDRSSDSPLLTMDGDVVGTPAYMPPEQARGEVQAMGPHSDVYAVGAMLYHLLAGHPPYLPPGVRASNRGLWQLVQRGAPQPVSDLAPHAPAELVAICERAMAREIPTRYADMSALAADLSAYLEGRVVQAYRTGPWAEARKWMGRNKGLAAALAASILAVVVGGIAFAFKADEATQAAKLAQANEREAEAQRDIARAETAKVLRLSDMKVLKELEAEADALWPPYPDKIAALRSWLERARTLADRLAEHRATLLEMRQGAHPWSAAEIRSDRENHPRAAELAQKRAELEGLIRQLEEGLEGEVRASSERRVAQLEPDVSALTELTERRRTWSFDAQSDQWQHDLLTELVASLELLETGMLAEEATPPRRGWSVPKRLAFALELERAFSAGGEYDRAWAAALPAIRAVYPGLDLAPQMGLVPIGPDPDSGLWEFAHLITGEPAERGPDGKLVLAEAMGVVLVLLPGGTFWMGAQPLQPNGRNFDPLAGLAEIPVHEVELSAFFLSKYELTQAQWLRLTGSNPSHYGLHYWSLAWQASGAAPTLLHPVETENWSGFQLWLARAGLALPTEAQWEFAARAGTETPWWTGATKETLVGAANLTDLHAFRQAGSSWSGHEMWLDDGATTHTEIGTYRPNAFGLHEITGNVWEWCQDFHEQDFYNRSPKSNPVNSNASSLSRVSRGGGFYSVSQHARSACRVGGDPGDTSSETGVRPARAVVQ